MTIIHHICAWCGQPIRSPTRIDDGIETVETSHGLCEIACYERWLEKRITGKEPKEEGKNEKS